LLLTWLLPMLLLTDLFPTYLFRLVQPTCHHATRTEVNPTNTTIAMTRERNFSVASFRAVFQLGIRSMLQIPWLWMSLPESYETPSFLLRTDGTGTRFHSCDRDSINSILGPSEVPSNQIPALLAELFQKQASKGAAKN
jgi:hypothetical protein